MNIDLNGWQKTLISIAMAFFITFFFSIYVTKYYGQQKVFVENGYEQTTLPGASEVKWQKVKENK